jgi:hypothetical protein
MIDIADRPGVEQLNIKKAGQGGVSSAFRWLVGKWACLDPDPCGITLPSRDKGRAIVQERILPFFRDTPVLARLMTESAHDAKAEKLRLSTGFMLYLMWSGSATSTSADPMRRVINDEVDKMKAWGRGGGEGHAVYRTKTRMRIYGSRGLQVNISTPTTDLGMISRLFADSDVKLYYLVRCPKCRRRIRLIWDRVKWMRYGDLDRDEWARRIRQNEAAWYECQVCGAKITEARRRRLVQNGMWGTIDEETLVGDGRVANAEAVTEWPEGTRIGMHISALYFLWDSLPTLAAAFLLAADDPVAIYAFRTETLGEEYEERITHTTPTVFVERSEAAERPEGVVPDWAAMLIAVADTQVDHFWLVIRAWGPGMRSARIWHGRVESFEELGRLCFHTPFASEGMDQTLSRTMEVYRFCLEHDPYVRAIKGDSHPRTGQFYRRGRGWYDPKDGRERVEVPLWLLDVHHFQDELAAMIDRSITHGDGDEQGAEQVWQLNARRDPEYEAHMSNLHKIAEPQGGQLVQRWVPVFPGRRYDYRAVEGYQIAAAYMMQMNLLPELGSFMAAKRAELLAPKRRPAPPTGITLPDGRPLIAEPWWL